MSRYDHTDPKMGTYRATLAAATDPNDVERLVGVGHDAQGRLVKGAGQTGITAVWVATKVFRAGKRVDPMTTGQIVEFGPTAGDPGVDFGVPGTIYYSDDAGNIESGLNEVQQVTVTNSANPFTLTTTAGATANIGGTATAAQVQTALEAKLGAGNVNVSGSGPYNVTFIGDLASEDIPQMTGSNATVSTTTAGAANTGLTRIGHTPDDGSRLIVRVIPA